MGRGWTFEDSAAPPRRVMMAAGLAALALVTAGACWLRIRGIDGAPLYMDNLHPPVRAVDILRGRMLPWRGEALGFHFGLLQTWLMVPLAAAASSLRQVWLANAVLHGLGTIPMGLAGQRIGGWGAGLAAAVLYACWPILVDHPVIGAWTYQAPLFVALAAWAAAHALERPSRLALFGLAAALAVALHMHPYALAPVLGGAVLLPRLVRLHGWGPLAGAAGVALLLLAPMLVDNAQSVVFGDRHDSDFELIEAAPEIGNLRLLRESVFEAGAGWPDAVAAGAMLGLPLALLALAALPARRRWEESGSWFTLWAVASYPVAAVIACILHYMRPSHGGPLLPLHALAVAWAPFAVAAAVAERRQWTERWRAQAVAGMAVVPLLGAAVLPGLAEPPYEPNLHRMAVLDPAAAAIHDHAAGEVFTLGVVNDAERTSGTEIAGWHADLWLRGARCAEFPVDVRNAPDTPTAYLAVSVTHEMWESWPGGEVIFSADTGHDTELRVLAFPDSDRAITWLGGVCVLQDRWPDIRISDPERSLGGLAVAQSPESGPLPVLAAFCAELEPVAEPDLSATLPP
jgi:hypothetical protein